MSAAYRGRFAPSPTGPLHMGSLVAALASWLDARSAGGEWLVRIEDIDTTRTVPGAAEDILATLHAFGLVPDGEVAWQTRRLDRYEAALDRLRARGEVYRCRCSRREIADSGLRGPEGPVYPGTCRDRPPAPDVPCAERFRAAGAADFVDRVQGPIHQDVAADIGDFVLKRRDGLHAYQLAVVVDDAEQGITDVVRGADLLWSTPRQILLQRALSLPTPRYLHVPIVTNAAGEKLSKQTLAQPIRGGDPSALRDALRWLGQEVPRAADPRALLAEAAASWRPGRIPRRERG
ncbi:MAG TPA: tRNA glutamyl-Q(34) synthetase GluQRS [Usitatibacter sp.]|nr:tRNA glutamyl-Q(34) synthetase GluQRS [Usitatibacter sp.]